MCPGSHFVTLFRIFSISCLLRRAGRVEARCLNQNMEWICLPASGSPGFNYRVSTNNFTSSVWLLTARGMRDQFLPSRGVTWVNDELIRNWTVVLRQNENLTVKKRLCKYEEEGFTLLHSPNPLTTLQILKPKLYLTFLELWCQQLNRMEGDWDKRGGW